MKFLREFYIHTIFFLWLAKLMEPPMWTLASGTFPRLADPAADRCLHLGSAHLSHRPSHMGCLIWAGQWTFHTFVSSDPDAFLAFSRKLCSWSEKRSAAVFSHTILPRASSRGVANLYMFCTLTKENILTYH